MQLIQKTNAEGCIEGRDHNSQKLQKYKLPLLILCLDHSLPMGVIVEFFLEYSYFLKQH